MGQPITVVEKPSSANPAILRLETNRPLSGMGHERYHEPPGELLQRPVDELARRLFAAGGVEGVHINGIGRHRHPRRGPHAARAWPTSCAQLFLHYGDTPTDTVVVPLDEADAAPEALADPADAPPPRRPPTTRRRLTAAADEPAADQEIPGIPDAELDRRGRRRPTDG